MKQLAQKGIHGMLHYDTNNDAMRVEGLQTSTLCTEKLCFDKWNKGYSQGTSRGRRERTTSLRPSSCKEGAFYTSCDHSQFIWLLLYSGLNLQSKVLSLVA